MVSNKLIFINVGIIFISLDFYADNKNNSFKSLNKSKLFELFQPNHTFSSVIARVSLYELTIFTLLILITNKLNKS